ncbi:MAG: hypothetical protein LBQ42_09030 [Synergistaceae bacterium]|jgi:hypothetical protein|nr:hypothetical protein [Synergistaceae bacterium]
MTRCKVLWGRVGSDPKGSIIELNNADAGRLQKMGAVVILALPEAEPEAETETETEVETETETEAETEAEAETETGTGTETIPSQSSRRGRRPKNQAVE